MLRKILCKLFWKHILTKIVKNEKAECSFLGKDLCDIHNHRLKFKYDLNKYFSVYKNEETHEYYFVYDNCVILTRKGICISTLKNFKRNSTILKALSELIINEDREFTTEEKNNICNNILTNKCAFKCYHNKILIV